MAVGDVADAVTVEAEVLVVETAPTSERAAATVAVAVVTALTSVAITAVTVEDAVIVDVTLPTSDLVAVTVADAVIVAVTAPASDRVTVTVPLAVEVVETSPVSSEPRHVSTTITCCGRYRPRRLTTTPPAEVRLASAQRSPASRPTRPRRRRS